MVGALEREIKLRFSSLEEARAAVIATGASPLTARRLQDDRLLDLPNGLLRERGSILRVRQEPDRGFLTFKGPVRPADMKLRDERETAIDDSGVILAILEELGFRVWFRYQKYREEFASTDVIVAVDETPVGTYVEIEGGDRGIAVMAEALGRQPSDYVLESYRGLYAEHCRVRGVPMTDMLFDGHV
jgi:adenylate cyclase class 2